MAEVKRSRRIILKFIYTINGRWWSFVENETSLS
jgi:hypothetical protein